MSSQLWSRCCGLAGADDLPDALEAQARGFGDGAERHALLGGEAYSGVAGFLDAFESVGVVAGIGGELGEFVGFHARSLARLTTACRGVVSSVLDSDLKGPSMTVTQLRNPDQQLIVRGARSDDTSAWRRDHHWIETVDGYVIRGPFSSREEATAERDEIQPDRRPTILEVWHGGIPHNSPPLPKCDGYCRGQRPGAHSHTQRISEAPFSIPWQLWIRHHMERQPLLVVHVYGRST